MTCLTLSRVSSSIAVSSSGGYILYIAAAGGVMDESSDEDFDYKGHFFSGCSLYSLFHLLVVCSWLVGGLFDFIIIILFYSTSEPALPGHQASRPVR